MARKSHVQVAEEDVVEQIYFTMRMRIPMDMMTFLEVQAKKLTVERKRRVKPQDIIRALITTYYEKHVLGLLVNPDD